MEFTFHVERMKLVGDLYLLWNRIKMSSGAKYPNRILGAHSFPKSHQCVSQYCNIVDQATEPVDWFLFIQSVKRGISVGTG